MPLFNDDVESMVMAARSTEALSFIREAETCRKWLEDEITAAQLEFDSRVSYVRQTFSNNIISMLRESQGRIREFSQSADNDSDRRVPSYEE